jgi:hypothetical protein
MIVVVIPINNTFHDVIDMDSHAMSVSPMNSCFVISEAQSSIATLNPHASCSSGAFLNDVWYEIVDVHIYNIHTSL